VKIHIAFDLRDTPTGGGNQFLKALRAYLWAADAYAEQIEQADVILTNGHQWGPYLSPIFKAKRRGVAIIHRVDGPMAVVRGNDDNRVVDQAITRFNRDFADATVFQSRWSRDLCLAAGMDATKPHRVILNAPDPTLFHPPTAPKPQGDKVRIVSTSWSSNWRKGFDVFQYLDRQLDWSKYEFTFIGNSPITFDNIRVIPPIPSAILADELRRHDIFLQASHLEACSNSLIEAMNCGLVAVARDNSSHPEIVGTAGVLYHGVDDVIAAIASAVATRTTCLANMPSALAMTTAGRAYLDLAIETARTPASRPGLSDLLTIWAAWKMAGRPHFFASFLPRPTTPRD
jgi:glycosyltransferase involved in cell wall biosynthesis